MYKFGKTLHIIANSQEKFANGLFLIKTDKDRKKKIFCNKIYSNVRMGDRFFRGHLWVLLDLRVSEQPKRRIRNDENYKSLHIP